MTKKIQPEAVEMQSEARERKSTEAVFGNSLNQYQQKALKPLLKREKELKGYIELLENYKWGIEFPKEVQRVHEEYGYDRWLTKDAFAEELKALREMIRRIEGKPKHYDNRPEQQLYYELHEGISEIIGREVGRHKFDESQYQSKVGYINTVGEVEGRVMKAMPTPWGENWHVSDVCSKIVDKIKEVKSEYPDFYKVEGE